MIDNYTVYDVAGIGIGPFNLGLAALCSPIKNIKATFLDEKPSFSWHEGMLIEGTTLQVPFLADLVTLVAPTSKYSYLNYLRTHSRLIPFGIHEQYYITRKEYVGYCRWVCSQLDTLHFNRRVEAIEFIEKKDCFVVSYKNGNNNNAAHQYIHTKKLVIGIGSKPYIPNQLKNINSPFLVHSSQYLFKRDMITKKKRVLVVGSGQSAAEIVYDLLERLTPGSELHWYTHAARIFPMAHTSFCYEHSTPDYIRYFYTLNDTQKEKTLATQDEIYKGVNYELLNTIYHKLYEYRNEGYNLDVHIRTNTRLESLEENDNTLHAVFHNHEQHGYFEEDTDMIILATGYHYETPEFIEPIRDMINFDTQKRYKVGSKYSIDNDDRIFIQNAEMHTHGFNAPDLGMGPYRNAVIINAILGYEYYKTERDITFQKFGIT